MVLNYHLGLQQECIVPMIMIQKLFLYSKMLKKFLQIKEWLKEGQFYNLSKWWENLNKGWGTFKNYFKHRVSSSLSEGINNVIKTVKKRAYGYRNMQYFKLKILQVCGYLNSKYIPTYF